MIVGQVAQLILPNIGGFRQLLLEKLHASKLASHLRVGKNLAAI